MADIVSDVFDWGIAMLMAFTMLIVFAMMIGSFSKEVDVGGLDPVVYLSKLHYSPYILYEDDSVTGLPVTGVLRTGALAELDVTNAYEDPHIAANITLLNRDRVPIANGYNNEELYRLLISFARNDVLGAGGAVYEEYVFPVAYSEGRERGYLRVEVVAERGVGRE